MEYLTQASLSYFRAHSSFSVVPRSVLLENLFCHGTPNSTFSSSLRILLDLMITDVSRRRRKRFTKPLSNRYYIQKLDQRVDSYCSDDLCVYIVRDLIMCDSEAYGKMWCEVTNIFVVGRVKTPASHPYLSLVLTNYSVTH